MIILRVLHYFISENLEKDTRTAVKVNDVAQGPLLWKNGLYFLEKERKWKDTKNYPGK